MNADNEKINLEILIFTISKYFVLKKNFLNVPFLLLTEQNITQISVSKLILQKAKKSKNKFPQQ